jgi:hypothetical protein
VDNCCQSGQTRLVTLKTTPTKLMALESLHTIQIRLTGITLIKSQDRFGDVDITWMCTWYDTSYVK